MSNDTDAAQYLGEMPEDIGKLCDAYPALALTEQVQGYALAAVQRALAAQQQMEVRADGKTVPVDRWQVGIRRIVALLWGNRREFEIDEVVEAVRALVPCPVNEGDDEGLVRAAPEKLHFTMPMIEAGLAQPAAVSTKAQRVHALVNDGPWPGMSEAFDAYMGADCWTDPAYRPDAATWAAAWKAGQRAHPAAAAPAVPQGWTIETGPALVSIRNTETQCGQDFYPDRDPLIYGFLRALAAIDPARR